MPVAEVAFGLKFWADFAKEALAAIAGAGVGAWLGARFAFNLERRKAAEDRETAGKAATSELAAQRATAGNIAVFTLSQIYNDLLLYEVQLLKPAKVSDSPWFALVPTGIAERNFYRFDVPSLAFLLQSRRPGAPEMLMRLALEQDRYAAFLDSVRLRAAFHEEHIPAVIEKLQARDGVDRKYTDIELQREVGARTYAYLRNYFADIEMLLQRGIESSKQIGGQFRALLVAELPGQVIISFESAAESIPAGSPFIQARNRAARASE